MEKYIDSNYKPQSFEKVLPVVVQKHTLSKERVTRPLLTNLQTRNQGLQLNLHKLKEDSKMRRNGLVLEDIIKERELE